MYFACKERGNFKMRVPRGIRNRNPGNIRISYHFDWEGEVRPPKDPAFCTFKEPVYGVRALMKLLINYQQKRDCKTLRQAINRWAPPTENDTSAYVASAAKASDISPDTEWDFTDRIFLIPVAKAIILHENGYPNKAMLNEGYHKDWYPESVYSDAYEMAVKGRKPSGYNELPEKEKVSKPMFKFLKRRD